MADDEFPTVRSVTDTVVGEPETKTGFDVEGLRVTIVGGEGAGRQSQTPRGVP